MYASSVNIYGSFAGARGIFGVGLIKLSYHTGRPPKYLKSTNPVDHEHDHDEDDYQGILEAHFQHSGNHSELVHNEDGKSHDHDNRSKLELINHYQLIFSTKIR